MSISRLVVIPTKKVKTFKYLGSLLTNQNSIEEEIFFSLKVIYLLRYERMKMERNTRNQEMGNRGGLEISLKYSTHIFIDDLRMTHTSGEVANQKYIHEEMKCKPKTRNLCYNSLKTL